MKKYANPQEYMESLLNSGMSEEEAIEELNRYYNTPEAKKEGLGDKAMKWAEDQAMKYAKDKAIEGIKSQLGGAGAAGAEALSNEAFNAAAAADYSSGAVSGAQAAMQGPTVSNAANLGATPAAGGGGTPMTGMGTPSYAGYAAAAMQGYNAIKNWDDIPDDMKATYAQQQAALAVANVYTGGLAGMAEGFARKQWGGTMAKLDKLDQKYNPYTVAINHTNIFGGKNKDQQARDALRERAISIGLADDKYGWKMEDGSTYDIGIDGKHGIGTFKDTGKTQHVYEVDFSDPRAGMVAAWATPLSQIITGQSGENRDLVQLGGFMVNSALSNTTDLEGARKNMLFTLKNMGLTSDDAVDIINQQKESGIIDQDRANAMVYSLGTLNSGNYGKGETPKASLLPDNSKITKLPAPADNIDPGYTQGIPNFKPVQGWQPVDRLTPNAENIYPWMKEMGNTVQA